MKEYILHNDDEELIRQIKTDNMFAFDAFYRKYCKRVYNFGYSILKSREESENLMQDVFLKFWENRRNIENDSSVRSYLFSIAYNAAISIIRKKMKDSEFVKYLESLQKVDAEPVDLQLEYEELANNIDKIINALPERQREVYLLHRVDGLKYSAIAQRLNLSINTIENHMARALKTIREKLGGF